MPKYTFQYFSDVHLEFYNENLNKISRLFDVHNTQAEFLLLAGDIGQPTKKSYAYLLGRLSPYFEKVFIIPGNHEYYNSEMSMTSIENHCRQICSTLPHQNVTLLQNEYSTLFPNLSVYGTTLWSHIDDKYAKVVGDVINDYKCIPQFTPQVSNALHKKAVENLNDYIHNQSEDQKVIVMTHHMPSFDLIDDVYKTPFYQSMNCAFASNIAIRNDPRIVAWVYGHTHKPKVQGKFYCNPKGYPGENNNWEQNTFFKVEV